MKFRLFQLDWVYSKNVTTAGRSVGRVYSVCKCVSVQMWTAAQVKFPRVSTHFYALCQVLLSSCFSRASSLLEQTHQILETDMKTNISSQLRGRYKRARVGMGRNDQLMLTRRSKVSQVKLLSLVSMEAPALPSSSRAPWLHTGLISGSPLSKFFRRADKG